MTRPVASQSFSRNESGNLTIVFGLSLLVFIVAAGLGIDLARVMDTKSRIVAAADAAALAAGRALQDGRLTDADVTAAAEKYFLANVANGKTPFGTVKDVAATLDRASGAVTVSANADVKMTLTAVAGFNTITVPVQATAKFDQHDIELSMALDVTGSMGGSKIRALKAATTDLVEILLPDGGTPNKVRIALAPYSSGVNAGNLASMATNGRSTSCTFEREGMDPTGDQAPSTNNFLKSPGYGGVAAGAVCPSTSKVVPLSSDKRTLLTSVDAYAAGGSTAGHVGVAWASYLISPKWASVVGGASAPVAYHDGKTIKAVVLMTDGLFNTFGGVNYGDSSPQAAQSQQTATSICQGLRDNGVTVYTIGFKLKDISSASQRAAAAQTLVDCAGSDLRYFDADDPASLRDAFVAIAKQLNNLRLTQ